MNIRNEKGSTVILFALFITIIMGFVGLAVDFGYAVLKDLQLTNAIDAATLAAAHDLIEGTTDATLAANEYLQKNGVDPSTVTITFSDDNHSIRLESNTTVNNRFIRVLGINTTGIGAAAKATINPITKVTGGIKPFGVEDLNYNYGDTVTLKTGDPTDENYGPGNFGALALGGTGNSNLLDNILYGYTGPVEVGDDVDTEPGNMASILKPIQDMIDADDTVFNENDPEAIQYTSGRVWIVPLVTSFQDVNGRNVVTIQGFAMFYVEDIDKKSDEVSVTGRFVRGITSGSGNEVAEETGLYAVKLVE